MKLPTWFDTPRLRRAATTTLFILGATWLVIRFCGLGVSPPGFFMDEAAPAVHAMCLAETGRDADGQPWPLYSSAAGGGHHPLTLMGFDILWIKIFGTSRAAFRAVSAFWILVTTFGLLVIARDLSALIPRESEGGEDGGGSKSEAARVFPWLVLLAALLSPWSFQFSRIGWEAPLAPAYMILSLMAMLRSRRDGRRAILWSAFAGFCAAASMTSYPPLRAVVPFVLAAAGVMLVAITREWSARWTFIKRLLAAGLVAAAFFAPTVRMLADGKINARMNNVAIWNDRWVHDNAGEMDRWLFLIKSFFDNVAIHLRPSFLFISGDATLRLSPQLSGQLSPVDMLALAFVVWMALLFLVRLVRGQNPLPNRPRMILSSPTRWLIAIALCALLGGFLGLVPAALTFEAIPHAMRAIGAWPFAALLTGAILAIAWSHRNWVAPVLALVALGHTIHYLPSYFHAYDRAANHWFMRDMTDVLEKERQQTPPKTAKQTIMEHLAYSYSYDEVTRYYLITQAKMGCVESASILRAYREAERQNRLPQ